MEQLVIKNYMEDLIANKMPAILKTMPDICQCDRCRMDMLAYALNNSPPKYVVTAKGKLFAKLNVLQGQFEVDVMRAITDAAVLIGASPRHDGNDLLED